MVRFKHRKVHDNKDCKVRHLDLSVMSLQVKHLKHKKMHYPDTLLYQKGKSVKLIKFRLIKVPFDQVQTQEFTNVILPSLEKSTHRQNDVKAFFVV